MKVWAVVIIHGYVSHDRETVSICSTLEKAELVKAAKESWRIECLKRYEDEYAYTGENMCGYGFEVEEWAVDEDVP